VRARRGALAFTFAFAFAFASVVCASGGVFAARAHADGTSARSGSLVLALVHRNDATISRFDSAHGLTIAWSGSVGGWGRLGSLLALDARAELFGVTVRSRPGARDTTHAHLGAELALVLDPTGDLARGLCRGVRVFAALDVRARLAGDDDGDGALRPRLGVGWVDVLAFDRGGFPSRPIRIEAGVAWAPGTVLLSLAIGVEATAIPPPPRTPL